MYPHQVMLIESAVICKWKVWTWTERWHGQDLDTSVNLELHCMVIRDGRYWNFIIAFIVKQNTTITTIIVLSVFALKISTDASICSYLYGNLAKFGNYHNYFFSQLSFVVEIMRYRLLSKESRFIDKTS